MSTSNQCCPSQTLGGVEQNRDEQLKFELNAAVSLPTSVEKSNSKLCEMPWHVGDLIEDVGAKKVLSELEEL